MDNDLPVTIGYWLAAFAPVLVLVILLVGLRWSTAAAAPVGALVAMAVALWLFQSEPFDLAVAIGKGIWDAIWVLYVVWPALILYQVAKTAGTFDTLEEGVRRFMPSRLLIILTFAWVISSFLQGVTGFGAPLAVVAPLMVEFGLQPVYAVLLPLLGRTWGNEFGTLGVAWFATLRVAEVPDHQQTIFYTAILLWVVELMGGIAIAWFYGRGWAIKRALLAILIISLIHGGLQLLITPYLPAMGNPIAVTVALLAVFGMAKWGPYSREDEQEPDRVFAGGGKSRRKKSERGEEQRRPEDRGQDGEVEGRSLWVAMAPYIALVVVAVIALVIAPVRQALESIQLGFAFPATETGLGVERPAEDPYSPFTPFTHPGTLLLVSALFGYFLYRSRGLYEESHAGLLDVLRKAAEKALKATTAITAILIISKVMDHSGQVTVLALGIAEVASDAVYLAVSNMIGVLGALVTSSNTASNILFAPLQATAARAQDLSVELVIAAQGAGGAIGNAIAPADILLGVIAAGIVGKLGDVLRKALPWTVITSLLVSAVTLLLYYFVV